MAAEQAKACVATYLEELAMLDYDSDTSKFQALKVTYSSTSIFLKICLF